MKKRKFAYSWGEITVQWNEASETLKDLGCSEMLVHDSIGKDPWTGGGITSADFSKALNELPEDRPLRIMVNSKGGDVWHGFAMKNSLLEWKNKTGQKISTVVTGIAASTSSWAFQSASDEVEAYTSCQIFMHDAMSFDYGNAKAKRQQADNLEKTSDQIAQMYSERTGKSKKAMREMMQNGSGTLLTGKEALEIGLVDKIVDAKAVRNFTPGEVADMVNRLSAMYNTAQGGKPKTEAPMNKKLKKRLIAMLNERGVTEWEGEPLNEDSTSDEHLEAALDSLVEETEEQIKAKKLAEKKSKTKLAKSAKNKADPEDEEDEEEEGDLKNEILNLRNEMKELAGFAKTFNEASVVKQIEDLVNDDLLNEKERPVALKRALKDPSYINEIKLREPRVPGASPLRTVTSLVGNSFADVQRYLLANGPNFMKNFIGPNAADNGERLGEDTLKDIAAHSKLVSSTVKQHRNMLVDMFNTNTIDAGLQRQIILMDMLEEFAVILLPFQNFSTVFSNVPLEGTDEVDVPFYPLATDAGTSWDPAAGYATAGFGNTTTNTRPVFIGGSGVTSGAAAAANTAKDRKWVGAQFSSYELARQPYLNTSKLMIQKANALGIAIFKDIVSRCITVGNFAASVKAVPAPQFSADDIADLWEKATGRMWPTSGRSLVLDHTYRTPLLKDNTYKQYLSYGATDPNRKAVIKEAYGFEDLPVVPNLTSYSPAGENLVGWIAWQYALLVATAPIMPTPEVRALMTRYDVVTHPSIGLSLEYRRFGDTTLDVTKETVECSYGASKGVASALGRITSA